ncbi:XRE family transcriptional regulator [Leptolyngbya boryana NIES-2135]|jgi:transcriptional regulator with XRE-family HTH domain|uniref:XRE family transcriptional regulator n=1 Tax=Leptolyngbya boryana NIES-2135 TaxID=1973484 RepID=A0A1Z4JPB5_LEPBY|nr:MULTISPECIES: helix-turn-helix transcriptional regulator [Leptolyngbya]BAY58488.1 XRE family transcriptional regulator [Leptolyngbya boryana NIES-2135]MBD2370963.1 helix-turn-helix domain-containing protein [Leptolyngbya sp. FACHB-161]MBD2377477.1 helix-turn-helix domain-containing protein [Leptolyngbya sp. FACHB-238]MBD2401885.1 helix-turn-helix domain-containing protein [Leptolyngbya sp. FACHB-239]MBD2408403.1 helix-turn-helix domain-containing protein [Leptolyngbya sp. FACHB-402]
MLVDVVRQIRVTVPDLEKRIKELREASGRSAQALATEAGISTAYWYEIEKGKRQYITEDVLRGIERALDTDFGVKFDG